MTTISPAAQRDTSQQAVVEAARGPGGSALVSARL
jgi:hypothetical protein